MSGAKTWIEISKDALKHNFDTLTRIAGEKDVMPVIKANGYGHGLLAVAEALDEAGAKWFAVDSFDEAMALRGAGYHQKIVVLGFILRDNLETAIKNRISFVLFNEDQLSYIEARKGERAGEKARIHIPVETGLYREGFELPEFREVIERVRSVSSIVIEGVQMHFANIEDVSTSEYAEHQLNEYQKYLDILNEYNVDSVTKHTGASAAFILYSKTHFDLLRPGIATFGLWPSEETKKQAKEIHPTMTLQPALTWKTVVAEVKHVRAGERIGYGLTEMLERDSKIAVLPIGYYDGFDRIGMSSKGEVLIREKRCKIVGRICMNMCMADVTDVPEVQALDSVVLIGKQGNEEISVEALADLAGTINYEIIARLGAHIERRLI